MTVQREREERADVLIVTAVKDEWDAVLAVDTGAKPGSTWQKGTGTTGPEVFYRDFTAAGGVLRVAVVQAFGMGREQAVIAASPLLERHPEIRCLAMCGVCAGRRGDVALGDVIIADRTWPYDAGKLTATVDDQGHRTERFQGDMDLYRIHPPEWKQQAERFQLDPAASWIKDRPRSYEEQGDWVLERLAKNEDPVTHPDRAARCPDWGNVLDQLWKAKRLDEGEVTFTEAGRKRIRRRMTLEPDGLREPAPFKVVVGPIASGAPVVEDPTIFDRLAETAGMRKVVGLEMETSAILALAHLRKVPHAVVMKGVMDHADAFKSDNMKPFAARASAECLIAFLRQNLPPRSEKPENDPLDGVLEPGTSALPKFAGPAALLNARHEIVPFLGRADVLEELGGWCEGGSVAAARLIHGPGGMGKTRLLLELCRRMRKRGWRAGFVPKRLVPARFAELVASEGPTLAVIDYAESRPSLGELLAPVLQRRNGGGRGRLRIVLLSRTTGDWWEAALRSEVADLLRDEEPRALSPLVSRGEERDAVFQAAVRRFAEQSGKAAVQGPTQELSDPRYDRVLYVLMAALATVEGRAVRTATLTDDTLNHEEQFWIEHFRPATDLDVRHLKKRIRRVVAALTLRGGTADEAEAVALVTRVRGVVDKVPIELLTMFLRDLYPGGASYLAGLEPDLLGEAMVHRALTADGSGVRATLDRVFEGANESAIRTGFEVLGRLSAEHAEVEGWIARVLESDVRGRAVAAFEAALAIAVGDPIKERAPHTRLGMALARALEREGTIEVARRLETVLPDRTVALREVKKWVTEALLRGLPSGGQDAVLLAERARLLNNLGNRQSELGQHEAALASTKKAITIQRRLADTQPEVFLPELVRSLNNLGNRQSQLGQREAALVTTMEAVVWYRKLAASNSEAFLPNLAVSLNNLATIQNELGQREAALASATEAVNQYRELVRTDPGAFLPHLAGALGNRGIMERELGRREAALASTHEAVNEYRELAEARPDTFLPELAMSLNNVGLMHSALGQHAAALTSTGEAVVQYRKLVAIRPEAFLPDLATCLNSLGAIRHALGQREAALASIQEVVEIRRKLVETRAEKFLPDLAMSVNNLGRMQSDLGQRKAALASTQEAVDLYRKLVALRPEAFLSGLAMSLDNHGVMQKRMGQREPALASAAEAVLHYCKLAEAHPDAFLPPLATSLNNLCAVQSELGQRDQAFASAERAVAIRRKLAASHPEAFLSDLAISVGTLGACQGALGQREAALASVEEAVTITRGLVATYPEAFLPSLAATLSNLSAMQSALGQLEAALSSADEAVVIGRKLAATHPEAFLSDLATWLNNLGAMRGKLGQHEAALVSFEEALDVIWPYFMAMHSTFASETAGLLRNVLRGLHTLAREPTSELLQRIDAFNARLSA